MTVQEAVGLFPSRTDGEVLTAHVLGKPRSWVFAHPHDRIPAALVHAIRAAAAKRKRHVPVAYIRGTQEFYGHTFTVDKHVLIPRPATERLVEIFLEWKDNPGSTLERIDNGIVAFGWGRGAAQKADTVVDFGTGSGCIAVSVAVACKGLFVIAVDRSTAALRVAKDNAERCGCTNKVTCMRASALPAMDSPYLIISNPPYIPEKTRLPADVCHEPEIALFAGGRGLDVLQELVRRAVRDPLCRGMLLECRRDQVPALRKIIAKENK